MKFLATATENDMVLAFLRGEIDSPRFGDRYHAVIANLGCSRGNLIDGADLHCSRENAARIELLGAVRGYGKDAYLFTGFPQDVTWFRVRLETQDWEKLKYGKHDGWERLSAGTRRVVDGARNVDVITIDETNTHIRTVAALIQAAQPFAEIIAVDAGDGYFVLVEGHTRATAFIVAGQMDGIEMILGTSTMIGNWKFL